MASPKSASSISGIVRWTVVFGLLIVIFFGLAYRVAGLQQMVENTSPARSRQGTEDQQLFFDLIRTQLLQPGPDGSLDQVPSDYLLVQRVEGSQPPPGVSRSEQARLLRELYASSVGVIVRQQVRLWNESRRIAAIRDNRPRERSAGSSAQWDAYSNTGHPLRTGSLVPETFGFVHGNQLAPGFTDWITVAAAGQRVTFRTLVRTAEQRSITIQVVGNPVDVPDGARVQRLEAPAHLHRNWPCDTVPRAAVITIPVRPGDAGTPVSVTVEPAVNCAPRVFGLAINLERVSQTGEDSSDATNRTDPETTGVPDQKTDASGEDQVGASEDDPAGAEPSAQAATEGWVYHWRPVPRTTRTAGRFTIYTADGIALTDPSGSGEPTAAAEEFGLMNLVGFGAADSTSLIGMLRRSRLPAGNLEIRLTVDSHIQRAAQTSLNYWQERWSNTRFGDERKGAVVVLDADTGAVLASANYPQPPANARPWDYAAFAHTNPLRDPMSIFGWEVSDKHNTPGSTFKPAVALALMRANDPTIRRLLEGTSPGEFARLTNLSPSAGAYYPAGGRRSVPNFGGGGMLGYFNYASRDLRTCGDYAPDLRQFAQGGQNQFGLTQAVQGSFNVWFARMAVMLDRPTIEAWLDGLETRAGWTTGPSSPPRTRLIEYLQRYGIDPDERIDLALNLPEDAGLFRLNTETGADILYSARPSSVLSTVEYPRAQPADILALTLFMVAQNGFGQSWSVTPLHMARVAATIGSNRTVRPYIFNGWGTRRLSPPEAEALQADRELLALLREGMKAVAEASHSTAGAIFGSRGEINQWRERNNSQAPLDALVRIKCRVYGKTGTADVSRQEGYNSGWFIGWLEPEQEDGRRIAFACMTSHAINPFRFGGSSCGRIIRDMLLHIEARNVTPATRREEGGDDAARGDAAGRQNEREGRAQADPGSENEDERRRENDDNAASERNEPRSGSVLLPNLPEDERDPGTNRPRNSP